LNPEDAQGHAWLGEILQLVINRGALPMEHLPEAVASLERALELDPNHSGAKMSLATCHRITGQEDLARDLYQDLTSVESVSAMAHYNLGIMDLGAGESLSALEHFQAGESLDPEDPDYPLGIARACIALGRKAQAKEALNRAMEIAPDHPRIEEIESQLGEYPANEQ
jgi:Flp pilus assembly protein TadD